MVLLLQDGLGPEPGSVIRVKHEIEHRVWWSVECLPTTNKNQSIWVHARMDNLNNIPLAVAFRQSTPELQIRDLATGKSQTHKFVLDDLQKMEWRRHCKPLEYFHDFRFDASQLGLEMGTGKYELKLVWPKDALRIFSDAIPQRTESSAYESKPIRLQVLDQPAPETTKDFSFWTDIEDVRDDNPNLIQRFAKLTNESKNSWFIPDYGTNEVTGACQTVVVLSRWNCHPGAARWDLVGTSVDQDTYMKHTHKSFFEIKPGESVTVQLPFWELDGNGHYRFAIDISETVPEDPQNRQLLIQKFSNPFLVGRKRKSN